MSDKTITGLRVDTNYATNKYIWVHYTTDIPTIRLARFTNVNDTLKNETSIVELPMISTDASGGCVNFLQDGTMYVSIGFDGAINQAQTYPFYYYAHSPGNGCCSAVMLGDFGEPGDFTPEYEGNFIFGDHNRELLFRMRLHDMEVLLVEEWATDVGERVPPRSTCFNQQVSACPSE